MTNMSGNAWPSSDRGPAHEKHTSVNGFNSQEVREALKRGQNLLFICNPHDWSLLTLVLRL